MEPRLSLACLSDRHCQCVRYSSKDCQGTRDGENIPKSRTYTFTILINPPCEIDELYKAGVETAPIFKRSLNESIAFDGVPEGSSVLVYKDTIL